MKLNREEVEYLHKMIGYMTSSDPMLIELFLKLKEHLEQNPQPEPEEPGLYDDWHRIESEPTCNIAWEWDGEGMVRVPMPRDYTEWTIGGHKMEKTSFQLNTEPDEPTYNFFAAEIPKR